MFGVKRATLSMDLVNALRVLFDEMQVRLLFIAWKALTDKKILSTT